MQMQLVQQQAQLLQQQQQHGARLAPAPLEPQHGGALPQDTQAHQPHNQPHLPCQQHRHHQQHHGPGHQPLRRAASAPHVLVHGARSRHQHHHHHQHPPLTRLVPAAGAAEATAEPVAAQSRGAGEGVAAGVAAAPHPLPQEARRMAGATSVVSGGAAMTVAVAPVPSSHQLASAATAASHSGSSSSSTASGSGSSSSGSTGAVACRGVMGWPVPPSGTNALSSAAANATAAAAAVACSAADDTQPATTSVLCSTGLIDDGTLAMPADGNSVAMGDSACFAGPPLAEDSAGDSCKAAAAALRPPPPALASAPPPVQARQSQSAPVPQSSRRLGSVLGHLNAAMQAAQPASAANAVPAVAVSAAVNIRLPSLRQLSTRASTSGVASSAAAAAPTPAAAGSTSESGGGSSKLFGSFLNLNRLRALFGKKASASAPRTRT